MSLFEVQKNAFIADLKKFRASHRHLIVDDTTYPIIEKLFNDDVLNYVYTCKKIDGERSKNRDSALYLLDPTRNFSINCLAADFSNGQRYKDTVVMFMPGPYELFWKDLTTNKNFSNSLLMQKTPHIVDYLSFVPLEPRVFVTGNFHSIPVYYNSMKHGKNYYQYQIDTALNSMMGLCTLTNEYPIVRYYNSKVSKELAHRFQEKLDKYYREHPDIIPINSKTVFLITDRTMDMFGPVCHYQYYRSQIFDLLDDVEIERDVDPSAKFSYIAQTGEGTVKKTLFFNETDPIYMELKDLTIDKATEHIKNLYKELKIEDEKFTGKNLETANGLRHALVNKDIHAERKALITGHYNLCAKMWDILEKEHLGDIMTFENLCAAGLGPVEKLKVPVTDGLVQLLNNPQINVYNKIRMLVAYSIYRGGIIKADLEKLLQFSMPEKANNVMKLFQNLQSIGFTVIKEKLGVPVTKDKTYFGVEDTEVQMKIYTPSYSNIISKLVYNKLSEFYTTKTIDTKGYADEDDESLKTFPFVKAGPTPMEMEGMNTVRNQPKWKSSKNSNDASRQKLILFCAGGLTPSELSSISSLENELNRNIIIGTDEIYTVWDMLGDITLIQDDEFDFPLKQKMEKKPIPQFLYDDSTDPAIVQKQLQEQQQQRQQQQQLQQQKLNAKATESQSLANESTSKHHHKLGFSLHGRKKSESNSGEGEEKKKKSMMKKFKNLNF